MMKKKAQAAIEYMLLFGISLLIVAVLWSTSGTSLEDTQWELQLADAKNSLDVITHVSDEVYIQGMPAQTYVGVNFPDNTRGVYLNSNAITLEMEWKGYLRNLTYYAVANLTGNINPAPGHHRLLIAAGPSISINES